MSGPTRRAWWRNARRGRRIAWRLMTEHGVAVVSPHLSAWYGDVDALDQREVVADPLGPREVAIARLLVGQLVFRVPDPPGTISHGAEAEVAHALTLGIPVVSTDGELRRAIREIRRSRRTVA